MEGTNNTISSLVYLITHIIVKFPLINFKIY